MSILLMVGVLLLSGLMATDADARRNNNNNNNRNRNRGRGNNRVTIKTEGLDKGGRMGGGVEMKPLTPPTPATVNPIDVPTVKLVQYRGKVLDVTSMQIRTEVKLDGADSAAGTQIRAFTITPATVFRTMGSYSAPQQATSLSSVKAGSNVMITANGADAVIVVVQPGI